jgi:hypothetical protein
MDFVVVAIMIWLIIGLARHNQRTWRREQRLRRYI